MVQCVEAFAEKASKARHLENDVARVQNELTLHLNFVHGLVAHDLHPDSLDRLYTHPAQKRQHAYMVCHQLCICMLQEVRLALDDLDAFAHASIFRMNCFEVHRIR